MEAPSLATQLGYYVNFGPYLSVGPEFAYSRFGTGVNGRSIDATLDRRWPKSVCYTGIKALPLILLRSPLGRVAARS
jgi:hypothetical protein